MKVLQIIDQVNDDNFTFYDNANGTILRDFEGFEYPSVRDVIEDVSGIGGAKYLNSKFGRRTVSWGGDLISSNVFSLRRDMISVLRQQGTMKLIKFTTYDDLNLQFEAEIVKVLNPYNHKVHTFLIEAVAPDWRFYSQTEKTLDTITTFVTGGGSIPTAVPMSLLTVLDEYQAVNQFAVNDGNEATDPILTIYGPGTDFIIGNQTTGKSMEINTTISGDEYIEIDVKERTVKLNGLSNIYDSFNGDFFNLEPGTNQLEFTIQSGIDESTRLHVSWRDAYNGI